MRALLRAGGLVVARIFGMVIRDYKSGEVLGRALVIPWRGKIHVIGLRTPVRLLFQPQERLTYWKQEIQFTTHPPPDFPNIRMESGTQSDLSLPPDSGRLG